MKSILLLLVIVPGLCAMAQDKKGPQTTEVSISYKLNLAHDSKMPPSVLDLNIQRLSGSRVIITWHTEAEIFKDGFEVERKKEGEIFTPIGFLPSKSDGSSIIDYSFTDTQGSGTCYYRLKQTDREGINYYTIVKMVK